MTHHVGYIHGSKLEPFSPPSFCQNWHGLESMPTTTRRDTGRTPASLSTTTHQSKSPSGWPLEEQERKRADELSKHAEKTQFFDYRPPKIKNKGV